LTVNTGNAKVGVKVIVGVGVSLGVKVSVGAVVFVSVGARVGVSVYVGVKVFVQEVAVLVAATEVWGATCSTLGPQAASEIMKVPINEIIFIFTGKTSQFPLVYANRIGKQEITALQTQYNPDDQGCSIKFSINVRKFLPILSRS
jgi:hypothetical protein